MTKYLQKETQRAELAVNNLSELNEQSFFLARFKSFPILLFAKPKVDCGFVWFLFFELIPKQMSTKIYRKQTGFIAILHEWVCASF